MKKIILISLYVFLNLQSVNASEITGSISTNMKPVINNNGAEDKATGEEDSNSSGSGGDGEKEAVNSNSRGGGAAIIKNQASSTPPVLKKENSNLEKSNLAKNKNFNEVKVLGISDAHFDDGMLVRGADMKVYIIEKEMKRYIPGLKELAKYSGREIFNVDDENLEKYKTIEKIYKDGELIRGYGEEKVYAIKSGVKHHIVSLEELKRYYSGLEIFNVSQAVLAEY